MEYTSKEIRIIINCSRTKLDSNLAEETRNIINKNIDWNYLITTAKLHKVAPLVFTNLIKIASDLIPQHEINQLQRLIIGIVRRNLYFTKELAFLQDSFELNKIQAIPYKGVILAATLYKDISLRQFTDLDFLVSRTKYLEAQGLLINLGYEPPPQNDVDWERGFVNYKKKIAVDLHQGLTPPYFPLYIDFQSFWQRLKSTSIGGIEVKSFAPEDMLIVLCIQLIKDSQWTAEVLIKVCDIAELLRSNPTLDWQSIWQRCRKMGAKKPLLFSLYVTTEILGGKIPDFLWKKIQSDKVIQQAALQVCEEFFDRSEESFINRTYKERIYLRKLLRERWQDRVAYFLKTAITPNERDREIVNLPIYFSFLYYLLRPVRLVTKYFKKLD